MNPYSTMTREELLKALEDFAKNWLAHDGSWFLATEERFGLETAVELDAVAWSKFAPVEARRILKTHDFPEDGGLEMLERALSLRMYSLLNPQRVEWSVDQKELRFHMGGCRVQETRRRKGLADFPCRSVGIVEFAAFAAAVDKRIITRCIHCPPESPPGSFCAWAFSLGSEKNESAV
jgi:hypothetical protein